MTDLWMRVLFSALVLVLGFWVPMAGSSRHSIVERIGCVGVSLSALAALVSFLGVVWTVRT